MSILNPADWTDSELLELALESDNLAWAELVRRYRALVYRCISKVLIRCGRRGNGDADEIFCEVLMNLLRDNMRKLRKYDPSRGTKLSSWIGMIAVNTAYDHLRSVGRRPIIDKLNGVPEQGDSDSRSPLDILVEKERWSELNELLTEFSPKDRTFMQLYYNQGLDPVQIAETMSISLKTVYSKKHKIREHLRRSASLRGDCAVADLAPMAA